MQEKSTQNFTARLEHLKFTLKLSDEGLSERVGISRRMLWLMRAGKAQISAKSLWKIESAEREAGIAVESFHVVEGQVLAHRHEKDVVEDGQEVREIEQHLEHVSRTSPEKLRAAAGYLVMHERWLDAVSVCAELARREAKRLLGQ